MLTTRRVLIVLSGLYILIGIYFIYCNIVCMRLVQVVVGGLTVGVLVYSDEFLNDFRSGLYGLIESIANCMTGIVPISVVTLGSCVIGIQVALIIHRRKQLISGQVKRGSTTTPSKTTKMLFSICVLYLVCSGFGFVLAYVVEMRPIDQDFALQKVLGCIRELLLCVNCVGDFVIYIRANNSFRRSRDMKRCQ